MDVEVGDGPLRMSHHGPASGRAEKRSNANGSLHGVSFIRPSKLLQERTRSIDRCICTMNVFFIGPDTVSVFVSEIPHDVYTIDGGLRKSGDLQRP